MKDKFTASGLAFFLWGIGVHKFYLRKYVQGVVYVLLTFAGLFYLTIFISLVESLYFLLLPKDTFDKLYNR